MKRAISLLLSLCLAAALLACPAGAASTQQQNRADALNSLHLFLGTGTAKGYDLDSNLNRNQGVILLVRILGKEQEAENGGFTHPFTDVPAGAAGAVAYAYSNHIVNGYTATAFGGSDTMSDTQFLALGYTDKGDAPDFTYAESRTFAQQLGLVTSAEHDAAFTRGDVVEVVWNALNAKLKGQEKTLAQQMMEQGVFTQALFDSAADIAKNGKPSSGGSTSGGSSSGGSSSGGSSSGGSSSGGATSGGSTSGGSTSGGSSSGGSTSGGSTSGGSSETVKKPGDVTWEEYEAMSGAERQEHFQQFESPSDYLQWMNEAKAAYDKTHPTIEVGPGGNVDLSEIIKGNS